MEFSEIPRAAGAGTQYNVKEEMKFLDGVIAQMRNNRGLGACIDTHICDNGERLSLTPGYKGLAERRRALHSAAKFLSYLDVKVYVRSVSPVKAELWITAEKLH